MLLSPIQVLLQVYSSLGGGQAKYSGHCINFVKDQSTFLKKIPALPEDLDVVIIRKRGANPETAKASFEEFEVNRARVTAYLRLFQRYHPWFIENAHLIDEEALASLPVQGNVYDRLKSVEEDEDDAGAADAGPPQDFEQDEDGVSAFRAISNGVVPNMTEPDKEVQQLREAIGGGALEQVVVSNCLSVFRPC